MGLSSGRVKRRPQPSPRTPLPVDRSIAVDGGERVGIDASSV